MKELHSHWDDRMQILFVSTPLMDFPYNLRDNGQGQ